MDELIDILEANKYHHTSASVTILTPMMINLTTKITICQDTLKWTNEYYIKPIS